MIWGISVTSSTSTSLTQSAAMKVRRNCTKVALRDSKYFVSRIVFVAGRIVILPGFPDQG